MKIRFGKTSVREKLPAHTSKTAAKRKGINLFVFIVDRAQTKGLILQKVFKKKEMVGFF